MNQIDELKDLLARSEAQVKRYRGKRRTLLLLAVGNYLVCLLNAYQYNRYGSWLNVSAMAVGLSAVAVDLLMWEKLRKSLDESLTLKNHYEFCLWHEKAVSDTFPENL